MTTEMGDIAVLHDRFPFIGGAETFAIEAAKALEAPIYTTFADPDLAVEGVSVIPLMQSKYHGRIGRHLFSGGGLVTDQARAGSLMLDIAGLSGEIEEYDVILSSGPFSKHYVPRTDQVVLNYPHSPPRYYYDQYRNVLDRLDRPFLAGVVKLYAKLWRTLDKEANDYVDEFIANSEVVRDRIRRYYGRDATVIYPPVTGDWRNEGNDGYFVTWSRLDPNKRIDLIARAFTELDEDLVIAGDGPDRERIERIAAGHDNIEVLGYTEDIGSIVAKATAVIYAPRAEDFGLVGAEALTAGKPLIGVDEGFTSYQVTEETGIAFDPTVESLREAVRRFDPTDFDAETIRQAAEAYEVDTFRDRLQELVAEVNVGAI